MVGGHGPGGDEATDDYRLFKRRHVLSAIGAGALSASAIGLGSAQVEEGADTHTILIGDPDGGDVNGYRFVVSGEVERLDDPRGDDVSADGTSASGAVAGGVDGYRYTGEIVSFEYEPEITVTIDGADIDPATLGSDDDVGDDDGSGEGPLTHTILISDPDGSNTNDYRFVVTGEVVRLDDPRGDSVSADGTEASGTVAGGRDGYRYTGEITLFEYEGEVDVVIDGQTVDPATLGGGGDDVDGGTEEGSDVTAEESPAGENEVRIVGVGERATYEFTVSGTIRAGDDFDEATAADSITGSSARGRIGGIGSDNLFYTGEITDWTLDGSADVFVNGNEVDPSTLGDGGAEPIPEARERELRINGAGERARASISVSGTIRPGEDFDEATAADSIAESSAMMGVGGVGSDNVFYTGEITSWSLDGRANVFIDGEPVDPDTLGPIEGGSNTGNGRALFIIDDGPDDAIISAKPVFDDFGYDATVAIITSRPTNNTGSSYLTFRQIERLDRAGWEIASHTVNHDKLTELSERRWKRELRRSARDLEEWGYDSNCIVYPKGGGSREIANYASRYYDIGFGGGGREPPNFRSKLRIGRYKSHEPSEVLTAIDRQSAVDGTVPIMIHNVVDRRPIGNETRVSELRRICRAVDDAGMDVLTASEYERTL